MICKIKSVIEECSMLKKGDKVIVALSGGADSMALAFFLNSVKNEYGFSLSAAHVNHGIRGENAYRDENFVKEFCEKNNIEFHVLHADVPKTACETGETEEECGRRIRYEFFSSIDENAKIATAHNLNDNAETLLFRMARGTGLKGLCAIPPVRGNIIRPLIKCSRAEIEKYCEENKIAYVTDETNLSDDYTRNYIRHELIPLFEKLNPAFLLSADRLISSLRCDEELLSSQTAKLVSESKAKAGYSAEVLKNAPEALFMRAVSDIIEEETGLSPERKHIEAVAETVRRGGSAEICGGNRFRVRKGILEKFTPNTESSDYSLALSEGINNFSSYTAKVSIIYKNDLSDTQKIHKQRLDIFIDCDKIFGKLIIRNKRNGDAFSPKGFKGTKKLKKLFQEKGIPPEKRGGYPVLCDDKGIIAVPGFGVSERVSVSGSSQKIYKVAFGGL